jgi:hypothetical protein
MYRLGSTRVTDWWTRDPRQLPRRRRLVKFDRRLTSPTFSRRRPTGNGAADLGHPRKRNSYLRTPLATLDNIVVLDFRMGHRSVAGKHARGGATPAGSRIVGYG